MDMIKKYFWDEIKYLKNFEIVLEYFLKDQERYMTDF